MPCNCHHTIALWKQGYTELLIVQDMRDVAAET